MLPCIVMERLCYVGLAEAAQDGRKKDKPVYMPGMV